MTSLIPSVTLVDGQPRVSSLDIAEKFGKPHKDVLNVIRRIVAELEPNFRERNFSPTFTNVPGPNGAVRQSPAYSLTRDAFSLVVMGFTGKQALAWKVKYIEAFNAMEAELLNKAKPSPRQRRSRKALPASEQLALPTSPTVLDEQTQKIQSLMNEVKQRGNEFMSSMFMLQSALRFRPIKMNPAVPDLPKALERTLPQFVTAIGMNVSALSDLLDVYSTTLAATE